MSSIGIHRPKDEKTEEKKTKSIFYIWTKKIVKKKDSYGKKATEQK